MAEVGAMTEREIEVLVAVADADSMEQAAERLGIDAGTLRGATRRIRRKLGVTTNLQAYRKLTKGVRVVRTTTTKTTVRLEEIDDA